MNNNKPAVLCFYRRMLDESGNRSQKQAIVVSNTPLVLVLKLSLRVPFSSLEFQAEKLT